MKLYLAEISLTVVVAAENEKEAYRKTYDDLYEIVRNESPDTYEIDVYEVDAVPPDWVDALPYGENPDELTCDQILEDNQ
jgi:hypothetical protein